MSINISLFFIALLLNLQEVSLSDTGEYASFQATGLQESSYPASNLFDADFTTCWIGVSPTKKINSSLFMKLPKGEKIVFNIFAGYGKNKKLYYKNSRPKKLKISIFSAVNPEGMVSETKILYKLTKLLTVKTIDLADKFGVQSFPLDLKNSSANIMKIEILERYKGGKYDDVCISEIFFNDRFVSSQTKKSTELMKDKSKILQLIEVSKDKKWAIYISMPAKIEGRAATEYLLVDLIRQKIVNSDLKQYSGEYLDAISFTYKRGKTYIKSDKLTIELR
ncbi:hypothetical protein KAH37_05490 [bacterium]|nr:hypothetical protein [bacterium]